MQRRYTKIKKEVMDLFGTISVEEIITNKPLTSLISEIASSLDGISIIECYKPKEEI